MQIADSHPAPVEPVGLVPRVVDATIGRAAALGLGVASRLRRQRIFHPDGVALRAVLAVAPSSRPLGSELLDEPAERTCTVRLSRGIGLPDGVADILGVAVRVPSRQGPQDLLFATVMGEEGPSRLALVPARSFGHRTFSTLVPYRTATGELVSLGLHPHAANSPGRTLEAAASALATGDLSFELRARAGGRVHTVGHLRGVERLPAEAGEALRFNPFNAAADLRPTGAVNALRRRSYARSQEARPDT